MAWHSLDDLVVSSLVRTQTTVPSPGALARLCSRLLKSDNLRRQACSVESVVGRSWPAPSLGDPKLSADFSSREAGIEAFTLPDGGGVAAEGAGRRAVAFSWLQLVPLPFYPASHGSSRKSSPTALVDFVVSSLLVLVQERRAGWSARGWSAKAATSNGVISGGS